MGASKNIIMDEVQQTATSTDNITLKGTKVPEDKVAEITYVAVKDETTTGKTLRIGYQRGGENFWLREEPATTNYHGIQETGIFYLMPNECIIGMIESPTSADVVKLFVRGKYLE